MRQLMIAASYMIHYADAIDWADAAYLFIWWLLLPAWDAVYIAMLLSVIADDWLSYYCWILIHLFSAIISLMILRHYIDIDIIAITLRLLISLLILRWFITLFIDAIITLLRFFLRYFFAMLMPFSLRHCFDAIFISFAYFRYFLYALIFSISHWYYALFRCHDGHYAIRWAAIFAITLPLRQTLRHLAAIVIATHYYIIDAYCWLRQLYWCHYLLRHYWH